MSAELANLAEFIPGLVIELRYATPRNFTGEILYAVREAWLRRPTATKLRAAQAALGERGLGLKIWDAFRPGSAQARLWAMFPDERFVAPPKRGSRHTRGTSVDVTLVTLLTGAELPMGTDFDAFGAPAAADWTGLPAHEAANRLCLRTVMEAHGLVGIRNEWWHFDDADWERFPPLQPSEEPSPAR